MTTVFTPHEQLVGLPYLCGKLIRETTKYEKETLHLFSLLATNWGVIEVPSKYRLSIDYEL